MRLEDWSGLATLRSASVLTHSDNRWVSGSGFQPSPKSPSATLDIRQTIYLLKNPASWEGITSEMKIPKQVIEKYAEKIDAKNLS